MTVRSERALRCRKQPAAMMLVALLAYLLHASPIAAQERVGVDSAVNPQATGSPPGTGSRTLVVGQDVQFNERLATGEKGQAQILFLDESALSIGPNSNIVVDQFVYDPRTGAGKLALNAGRGVFRYVGGKLSKQEDAVTLTTAAATMGIRGGIFVAEVDENGGLTVALIYGAELNVTGKNGGKTTIKRPGFAVRVERPGASPSEPARLEHEKLSVLIAQFEGRAGANGGATERPTDAKITTTALYRELERRVELPGEHERALHELRLLDHAKLHDRLHLSTVTKQIISKQLPALFTSTK